MKTIEKFLKNPEKEIKADKLILLKGGVEDTTLCYCCELGGDLAHYHLVGTILLSSPGTCNEDCKNSFVDADFGSYGRNCGIM